MSIENTVDLSEIFPSFSEQFLEPFADKIDFNLKKGIPTDFKIRKETLNKVNSILILAKPEDAKIITEIIKEDYEGTYPYKEMEDEQEVKRMIETGEYKFVLFKNKEGDVLGTTCFGFNFKEKKGYLRSLVVRKKMLGVLDATKAYIGSCLAMWEKYKDQILIWWGEARTADAKSQHINRLCSVRPIALLPNKDIFYNKIESDLVMISYSEKVLRDMRCKKIPEVIFDVVGCFAYSNQMFSLGPLSIAHPELDLDDEKITFYRNKIEVKCENDKFGYEYYKLSINGTNTFLKFLHTPRVKNFEKTEYEIENLEQLAAYIYRMQKIAEDLDIRYYEVHVSAYKPIEQQIFRIMGLKPRGYIPCWKLDKETGCFDDYILFNNYKGEMAEGIELIPEGKLLYNYLININ